MYKGPALPRFVRLPFALEVRFLLAVGAGKDGAGKWSHTSFATAAVEKGTSFLTNLLNGTSNAEKHYDKIVATFVPADAEGKLLEDSEFKQRLKDAFSLYPKGPKRGGAERANLVKKQIEEAASKYKLGGNSDEWEDTFQRWARALRSYKFGASYFDKFDLDDVDSSNIQTWLEEEKRQADAYYQSLQSDLGTFGRGSESINNAEKQELKPRSANSDEANIENWTLSDQQNLDKLIIEAKFVKFTKSNAANNGVRDFVSGNAIPYFSRSDYAIESGENITFNEEEQIQDLANPSKSVCLIFSGHAGTGKSRLASYLYQKIEENGLIIEVRPYSKIENLPEIIEAKADHHKLTLLIDYAENVPSEQYRSLVSVIENYENIYELKTNIIVCCRSSALRNVRPIFRNLNPQLPEAGLSPSDRFAAGYQSWVVQKILDEFEIEEMFEQWAQDKRLPILAAFAAYLKTSNAEILREQFGSSDNKEDLDQWFENRVKSLAKRSGTTFERLAKIACSLPITQNDCENIFSEKEDEQIFKILINDGWVEYSDGKYQAAHDIFADQLMLYHIARGDDGSELWVKKIVEFGLRYSHVSNTFFSSVLDSLARVAHHRSLANLSWTNILSNVSEGLSESLYGFAVPLFDFPVLSTQDKVNILGKFKPLARRLSQSPTGKIIIANLAYSISLEALESNEGFEKCIDEVASSTENLWKILPALVEFDPEKYATPARRAIKEGLDYVSCGDLISAYLRATKRSGEIANDVKIWIGKYFVGYRTQKVVDAWLKADGDIEILTSAFEPLFNSDPVPKAAYKEIQLLIEVGDQSAVRNSKHRKLEELVRRWLALWGLHVSAGYVLQKWLVHNNTPSLVQPHLVPWLDIHAGQSQSSYFLIKCLQQTNAPLANYRDYLPELVEAADNANRKLNVCNIYAQWGEEFEVLKPIYLEVFETNEDSFVEDIQARFSFESWHHYNSEGCRDIKHYMARWLNANWKDENAYRVFVYWIENGFGVSPIEKCLESWLQLNSAEPPFKRIYKWFAQNAGTSNTVVAELRKEFERDRLFESDVNELQESIKTKPISEEKLNSCLEWLRQFPDSKNAVFLLRFLLPAFPDNEELVGFANAWLSEWRDTGRSGVMIRAMMEAGYSAAYINRRILHWLKKYPFYDKAGKTLLVWLNRFDNNAAIRRFAEEWLDAAVERNFPNADLVDRALTRK